MNIQDLKSNTTWQEASNTINNNNNKISLAIATLENATLKNKGYFTTVEKLNEAIPNPTIGNKAYVGTSEPYAIYIVENGIWVDSGYTGGDEIVAKITTDRIEDGAVTSEKIATSAFDSTLSVSGKIAPAYVVGGKLTDLEGGEITPMQTVVLLKSAWTTIDPHIKKGKTITQILCNGEELTDSIFFKIASGGGRSIEINKSKLPYTAPNDIEQIYANVGQYEFIFSTEYIPGRIGVIEKALGEEAFVDEINWVNIDGALNNETGHKISYSGEAIIEINYDEPYYINNVYAIFADNTRVSILGESKSGRTEKIIIPEGTTAIGFFCHDGVINGTFKIHLLGTGLHGDVAKLNQSIKEKTERSFNTPFFTSLLVDGGKKYISAENWGKLINAAGDAGFNMVHMYLSDVNGFYFKLNDWNISVDATQYDISIAVGGLKGETNPTQTPWITEEQMDTLIGLAKTRKIEVVPAFDMPAHMSYTLSNKFPQFNGLSTQSRIDFKLAIIDKLCKYFKSRGCKYYNLCADEYKGEQSQYLNFIKQALDVIRGNGLIPMIFNDAIEVDGSSAPYIGNDVVIIPWHNYGNFENINKYQELGYSVINASSHISYLVFNNTQWDESTGESTFFDTRFFVDLPKYGVGSYDKNHSTIEDMLGCCMCIWNDVPGLFGEEGWNGDKLVEISIPYIKQYGNCASTFMKTNLMRYLDTIQYRLCMEE